MNLQQSIGAVQQQESFAVAQSELVRQESESCVD